MNFNIYRQSDIDDSGMQDLGKYIAYLKDLRQFNLYFP